VGIVSTATGLDDDEANRLLEVCHGEIKTAIVAQLASVSADEARRRLQASQGIVRAALSTPS
jgi:N-acetylmuramic acid 6-phosphate etherase